MQAQLQIQPRTKDCGILGGNGPFPLVCVSEVRKQFVGIRSPLSQGLLQNGTQLLW